MCGTFILVKQPQVELFMSKIWNIPEDEDDHDDANAHFKELQVISSQISKLLDQCPEI